jgi:phage terminase small subunit
MRGRKPESTNVVPLKGGDDSPRFDAMAKAKARKLKPRGLADNVSKVWNRLAPAVCHPTVDRLKPHNVHSFVMLCQAVADNERYRGIIDRDGETYGSETRNGAQFKMRPEVGQKNETFRQALTLLRDFGLTPAAERGVKAAGEQGAFDFDKDDFA